jgi:ubiquinone/menaquinone biosynthesis C-methylase UbiE
MTFGPRTLGEVRLREQEKRSMRGIEQVPWCYDSGMWVMEKLGLASWRRWLVRGAHGRILELGCGTGRNLPLYAPESRIVALDPNPEALRSARSRSSSTHFVRGRAEALPFRDGCFDTVVSGLVFCSVADPLLGFREVRRVLKSDGTLRMLEHVRHPRALIGRMQDWVEPAWNRLSGGCHPNRDTEDIVRKAGFRIEREEGDRRGESGASGILRRFRAGPV